VAQVGADQPGIPALEVPDSIWRAISHEAGELGETHEYADRDPRPVFTPEALNPGQDRFDATPVVSGEPQPPFLEAARAELLIEDGLEVSVLYVCLSVHGYLLPIR